MTIFCVFNQSSYFEIGVTKIFVIIILLFIILGYLPQIMGVLHFWVAYSIQHNMTTVDGGEQVAMVICFWLMIFSLFDNRINHWHKQNNKFPIGISIGWAILFIIQVQVSYLYLNSSITKMKNLEWLDGTAVYYYLNDTLFGLPPILYNVFSSIIESPFIVFITWGTLLLQLILAGAIFANQKIKNIIFIIAILMHEMFAIFMGLISFSIVMIAVLILYLKPINIQYRNGEYINEKNYNNSDSYSFDY